MGVLRECGAGERVYEIANRYHEVDGAAVPHGFFIRDAEANKGMSVSFPGCTFYRVNSDTTR